MNKDLAKRAARRIPQAYVANKNAGLSWKYGQSPEHILPRDLCRIALSKKFDNTRDITVYRHVRMVYSSDRTISKRACILLKCLQARWSDRRIGIESLLGGTNETDRHASHDDLTPVACSERRTLSDDRRERQYRYEYGTFPLYPAKRIVEAGEKQDSAPLQWVGYGVGLPLFVVAMPFALVGAGVGAILHPWTKCDQREDDEPGLKWFAHRWLQLLRKRCMTTHWRSYQRKTDPVPDRRPGTTIIELKATTRILRESNLSVVFLNLLDFMTHFNTRKYYKFKLNNLSLLFEYYVESNDA